MRGLLLAALAALGLATAALAQDAQNVLVIDVEGEVAGTIEIELLPEVAPQHVERIKTLARDGAYDGVAFHRVIDGFMAQTGDVEFGTREAFGQGRAGTGGSALPDLPAEFSDIPFDTGVVGMARSQSPDSANSQFFIMTAPAPHLNGQYTVVGRVIAGQDVVDAIKRGGGSNGMVADPDVMARVHLKAEE
ncbi:MAG TPA: peptidylprolyl isomerase [Amaricoccus sp.]|uniref:peptidylprolyl isomerase n=1 Tax=Amaricoccus sp. TaxID=1872485 RepID=UPI002C3C7C89|nr:peptidylprolyl isomerase [Amaricoccus sp.]HPG21754.1 peptidylprolyl isomerase [Amaricoccus sp.]HRW14822.1 peptidylprolyl isomerase [Amaricoccus sp.]